MISEISSLVFLIYAIGVVFVIEQKALGLGASIVVGTILGVSLHLFQWLEKLYLVSDSKYDETSLFWLAFWVLVGIAVSLGPYIKRKWFTF